jgi:pimeloyl-ACP methyl ester carboxylesterase
MKEKTMRLFLAVLLCLSYTVSWSADYAREKRWADEIAPNIVVGDAIYLEQKNGHKFLTLLTEAKDAKLGVIVVHGSGMNPDWELIGALRTQLAEQGYTTLSVQMPVLAKEAKHEAYPGTFPEAVERLQIAADFLKSKGFNKIAIVSHSMGSRMSHAYLSKQPDAAVVGWAALGILQDTYTGIKIPVLDLYGQNDLPEVVKNAGKRGASLKGHAGSSQIAIPKADHFYNGHETEMVAIVKRFLDSVK